MPPPRLFQFASIASFCLLLPHLTFAASFDCTKASTDVELSICGSETLSKLDDVLGEVYRERLAADPAVKQAQIAWLRTRNRQCGGNADCLRQVIAARIAELGTSDSSAGASNPAQVASSEDKPTIYESGGILPARAEPQRPPEEPQQLAEPEGYTESPSNAVGAVDPLKAAIDEHFIARNGKVECIWPFGVSQDLVSAADQPDPGLIREPTVSNSNPLSGAQYGQYQAWHACNLYLMREGWLGGVAQVIANSCDKAASGVRIEESAATSYNSGPELKDPHLIYPPPSEAAYPLFKLDSTCGVFARSDAGAREYVRKVHQIAERAHSFAGVANRRVIAEVTRQRQELAAAAKAAEVAAENAAMAQQEARRQADAEKFAAREERRRKNAAEAAEDKRIAERQRAETEARCAKVLDEIRRDQNGTIVAARQISNGEYVCDGVSPLQCSVTSQVAMNVCGLKTGDVATCLVAMVNNCGGSLP